MTTTRGILWREHIHQQTWFGVGTCEDNRRPWFVLAFCSSSSTSPTTDNKMSTSTDPLLALRSAIQSKSPITYMTNGAPSSSLSGATHIVLSPTLSFPKNTPTRLQKPGLASAPNATARDPQANPSDFFTLEAVYLAWLLREASGADYARHAREHGLVVGFVSITERKTVVDWLEGRTSTHQRIVPLAGMSIIPKLIERDVHVHSPCSRLSCAERRLHNTSGDAPSTNKLSSWPRSW